MIRARALVWIGVLTSMILLTLSVLGQKEQKPWWDHRPTEQGLWDYSTMTDDRIVLRYPDIMPEEAASALLENRRAALEFVEDFLQVKLEKPLTIQVNVSLIATAGEVIASLQPEILFHIPFYRLQGASPLSEGNAHEETHVVATHAWSPPLCRFLGEGIAVAIDFCSRPRTTYNPHLFSKGLALMDELMPIESLFLQRFDPLLPAPRIALYTYVESASFVLFLIDRYGLEKLKQLNEVSGLPLSMFEEQVCKIYDQGFADLEQDWLLFLEGYAVGQEARARHFAQAMFDFSDRVVDSLNELEEYWKRSPFQLVSPSKKISDEYGILTRLLVALGNFSDQGITSSEADEAYEAFEKALTAVESSLTLWLRAIQMFESVLNLIVDVPDYEDVIAKLEEAQTLYRQVGNNGMVTRTSEYIAAFLHLQQGEIAVMHGNHDLAQQSLSMALGLFSKLDEQGIIHHVKRLLELSRHVVTYDAFRLFAFGVFFLLILA